MEAKQYWIYLFRIKKTGEVIYVGSTRAIGQRLNEHRRGLKEEKHRLPIHEYMIQNNLKLYDDVEICLVEFMQNVDKETVLAKEAEYFYRYRDTVKNTRPAEDRTDEFATRNQAVRCLNDGKEFYSLRNAAEYYGLNRATISNHLKKGSRIKKGLVFEYINSTGNDRTDIYVIECVEDKRFFSSFKLCAQEYGMTVAQIYNRMRKGVNEFQFCGKHFRRCNDYPERE